MFKKHGPSDHVPAPDEITRKTLAHGASALADSVAVEVFCPVREE